MCACELELLACLLVHLCMRACVLKLLARVCLCVHVGFIARTPACLPQAAEQLQAALWGSLLARHTQAGGMHALARHLLCTCTRVCLVTSPQSVLLSPRPAP